MTRHWASAGVRATPAQTAAARAKANPRKAARLADLDATYRMWRAGQVKPYMITFALDKEGLDGPEVDIACGAQEPDVDRWEAGLLYPTWTQLLLLAELTRIVPRMLCVDEQPIPISHTSMRFHIPQSEQTAPVVKAYNAEVVAATVKGAPERRPS